MLHPPPRSHWGQTQIQAAGLRANHDLGLTLVLKPGKLANLDAKRPQLSVAINATAHWMRL